MNLVPIGKTGITLTSTLGAREVVAQVIEATVALYSRRGYEVPWIGYLAVEGNEFIGGCGFTGPPVAGEVEIAYFTFPGNEGPGVATQMARELLRISRQTAIQAGIRLIAHTLPEEGPSTSILRKIGFHLDGEIAHPEDGAVWKWLEHGSSEAQPCTE